MIDLEAIRARDATQFEMYHKSCHDRRALLAYVDELLAERALIVQRAENAEAALAYAVSTGDECAIEVEALRARLATVEDLLRQNPNAYASDILAFLAREKP